MPVAIPTWRNVLLMPDAIPARCTATVDTAVVASGAFTKPIPMPPRMKPGSSTVQCELALTRLIDHIAIAFSASPNASSARTGTRPVSRPASGAAKNETTESGRNRTPVSSGESPRMFWR